MSDNPLWDQQSRLKNELVPKEGEDAARHRYAANKLRMEFDRLDADPFFNIPHQDVFEVDWNNELARIELRRHGDLVGCWIYQHTDSHYVFDTQQGNEPYLQSTSDVREISTLTDVIVGRLRSQA